MSLIDVDKLLFSLKEWELNETPISTYPKPKEFTADDMQRMIWRTIRDCESAVEEQPSVKAIPVEWIEEYAKSLIIKRRFLAENGFRDNRCYDYMFGIIGMLDDWDTEIWEKENDTN